MPKVQFTHPLLDYIGLGEVGPSVDLCHDRAELGVDTQIGFIMVIVGPWKALASPANTRR